MQCRPKAGWLLVTGKQTFAEVFHVMPKALKSLSTAEGGNRSPRVTALAWGRIEIEGVGAFRDAKVFPGGAREWDWNDTGTAHEPGIQPADVTELLAHGATTIVLSQGMLNRLHVCPKTLQLLADRRVQTHVLPTEEAVALYNRLRDRQQVAGLFHTTC
jgi:hypothetical protein